MDFDCLLLWGLPSTRAALLATFPLVTLHRLNSLTSFRLARQGAIHCNKYIAHFYCNLSLAL